jgi:hypothetical protein
LALDCRDIVGRASGVKLIRSSGEFVPEYMRFMAWKSSGSTIRGTRLPQVANTVANAAAIV